MGANLTINSDIILRETVDVIIYSITRLQVKDRCNWTGVRTPFSSMYFELAFLSKRE